MSRFSAIDLSQLAPPQLIETISYESILEAQKAWVVAQWDALRVSRPDLPALDTLGLETEPITIILEVMAYRETLLRSLVNDKARAVLLAYAVGTDLVHLGALYGVGKMAGESDDRYRRRIQLAPEAFSVAGPAGAYEFHALSVSLDIADAHAYSPGDGRVAIVLAGVDGVDVSDAVLNAVFDRLDRDDVVPLTDQRSVVRATKVFYDVALDLVIQRGPDPATIKTVAEASVRAYAASRYRIGAEVYGVGITAAAKVGGVDNIIASFPDVVCGDREIPVLRNLAITSTII
ncbi:baseplate J/gp47 family protein [Rhodopseudomonas sp. P2A-2r]|uniref:baseplate assembly protein n=1 Tax=Rhodopseudomonas sp. P2A-2r TaxID=2991972 RepID=UPI002234893A|nr:baseplate J/gp47 family protein [Rhodopseudomonas sp. P2A-2r]UZE51125.1 baseplate J/gp47 family protein [Rhodopseudomonas sp. P2A-2r]